MNADFSKNKIAGVRCRGICYRYGDRYALYEVDVDISAGAVCVLAGPNGSGKTTLLDILSMAKKPQSGIVSAYDDSGADMNASEFRSMAAALGHEPLSYSELTPRENAFLFLKMWGHKDPDALATKALESMGMDPCEKNPVGRLSEGEQKRVALAIILGLQGRALFLDEPFSGLDSKSRERLLSALSVKSSDSLVVLSTHDKEVIAELGKQLVAMDGGRVIPVQHSKPTDR